MRGEFQNFIKETEKVLVGFERTAEAVLIAMMCRGHILLEGPPGVAKTTLAKTVAKLVDVNFRRVQFTPDLLPTDIIGTVIFNPRTGEFSVRKGPIFTNLLLADEINRASPKTQSALLEAMEERQVTIEGNTFALEEPFIVIATQNPVEQEGTYPLPEAQLDRFLFKMDVGYPGREEEKEIMRKVLGGFKEIKPVFSKKQILSFREILSQIHVSDNIIEYVASIVSALRENPVVAWGPSPRASLALINVSRAVAFSENRTYVKPRDVRKFAVEILQHRIGIKPESETEGVTTKKVVTDVLEQVDAV